MSDDDDEEQFQASDFDSSPPTTLIRIGNTSETPQEEIDLCLACKLPDCCPANAACGLRQHLQTKYGRRIRLK